MTDKRLVLVYVPYSENSALVESSLQRRFKTYFDDIANCAETPIRLQKTIRHYL